MEEIKSLANQPSKLTLNPSSIEVRAAGGGKGHTACNNTIVVTAR